jgi:hypothetical protein
LKTLGTDCTDLPTGQGYEDASFFCPSPGSYYGLVGAHLIHIGPFFGITDAEHVAQDLVRTLKWRSACKNDHSAHPAQGDPVPFTVLVGTSAAP